MHCHSTRLVQVYLPPTWVCVQLCARSTPQACTPSLLSVSLVALTAFSSWASNALPHRHFVGVPPHGLLSPGLLECDVSVCGSVVRCCVMCAVGPLALRASFGTFACGCDCRRACLNSALSEMICSLVCRSLTPNSNPALWLQLPRLVSTACLCCAHGSAAVVVRND